MIAADELSQEEKEIVCLTLALMYRTSWIEKVTRFDGSGIRTTWKGYDFRVLNMLEDLGLIDSGKRRSNKSASFTEKGEEIARRLVESFSIDEPVSELFDSLKILEEGKAADSAE